MRHWVSVLLYINKRNIIYEHEVKLTAIRAQGPGGQHVNKTSTAISLQFDTVSSSLSQETKNAILNCNDYRVSKSGLISIKAQRFKSQEQNKVDAIKRLEALIKKVTTKKKKRIPTKPTKSSNENRITKKKNKSKTKRLRIKPDLDD